MDKIIKPIKRKEFITYRGYLEIEIWNDKTVVVEVGEDDEYYTIDLDIHQTKELYELLGKLYDTPSSS